MANTNIEHPYSMLWEKVYTKRIPDTQTWTKTRLPPFTSTANSVEPQNIKFIGDKCPQQLFSPFLRKEPVAPKVLFECACSLCTVQQRISAYSGKHADFHIPESF